MADWLYPLADWLYSLADWLYSLADWLHLLADWQEQSQTPAGAKSDPGRSKVRPRQEQSQTLPHVTKGQCETSHCTKGQCEVKQRRLIPGRSKVRPRQEQSQTPAGAKSDPPTRY